MEKEAKEQKKGFIKLIMHEKQYLVTIIQGKDMIQRKVAGSLEKARMLAEGICRTHCRQRREVEGTILEIGNDKVVLYMPDADRYDIAERNLDKDLYIIQKFIKDTRELRHVETICTDDKEEYDTQSRETARSGHKHIINKVNYRGVWRIDKKGAETKVNSIDFTYDREACMIDINDELEIVRL